MHQDLPFSFRVERSSRRRTLSLVVDQAEVVVRAPKLASATSIEKWVRTKSDWIEKHLRNQQRASRLYGIRIEQGSGFLYEGRRLHLHWQKAVPAGVRLEGDALYVNISPRGQRPESERVRAKLQEWLRHQAELRLPEQLRLLGHSLQLNPQRVEIKSYRRKWGQCSSTGVITLNWRLMHLPLALQRYVMIHELCHLRQMNHSRRFWALVERFCPEYRDLQRQMQQMGPILSW